MKTKYLLLTLFIISISVLSVCADSECEPIVGAWRLDRVYENASSDNPVLLEPESAASLYAEAENIYFFEADGSASETLTEAGEIIVRQDGISWKKADGLYQLMENDDISLELTFDEKENAFHRYWNETAADATYHDLDFVYVRVPVGSWKMTQVYSVNPGEEPKLLDPENSASLYSESSNIYTLKADGTAEVLINGEFTQNGEWNRNENVVSLVLEDGDNMELSFDPAADLLHRYWNDEDPDAAYHQLDFVYTRD